MVGRLLRVVHDKLLHSTAAECSDGPSTAFERIERACLGDSFVHDRLTLYNGIVSDMAFYSCSI